jgi:transposase-like protein
LTKNVLETALEAEITEHLGHERHGAAENENVRNGTLSKTVFTEIGPVETDVPRDREGSFEPQIVKKRQRRLDGIDEVVLSLTARGLTTGEIAAHFDEVYGATVSKDTISRSPRRSRKRWPNGPTGPLAASTVLFIDAIHVKGRDGQVRNRPFYIVLGVT